MKSWQQKKYIQVYYINNDVSHFLSGDNQEHSEIFEGHLQ